MSGDYMLTSMNAIYSLKLRKKIVCIIPYYYFNLHMEFLGTVLNGKIFMAL